MIISRHEPSLLWHGIGTREVWERLKSGYPLAIPDRYAHDPGDFGRALYFTDSKERAMTYAVRLNDSVPLLQARVYLKNPLVIDWRGMSPLDADHPANRILAELEKRFGNPVRGAPEARELAARRWREGLMEDGYDGVISIQPRETEVAVYDPKKSVTGLVLQTAKVGTR